MKKGALSKAFKTNSLYISTSSVDWDEFLTYFLLFISKRQNIRQYLTQYLGNNVTMMTSIKVKYSSHWLLIIFWWNTLLVGEKYICSLKSFHVSLHVAKPYIFCNLLYFHMRKHDRKMDMDTKPTDRDRSRMRLSTWIFRVIFFHIQI